MHKLLCFVGLMLVSPWAISQTVTSNLTNTATVVSACSIQTIKNIEFGATNIHLADNYW